MTMIDPTYLRTLVDGLKSGAFQKGNPSSLPEGLVGVYEEALPPENNVNERSKFLSFFGVWALLRKEASTAFVASLLEGWTETDVLDWISMYSRWFNSPTAGTYVLYHERFRAFLLQKISQDELFERNQRIINLGYSALKNRMADEWEHYALEYQSSHLLMAGMYTKTVGEELKRLAYDTAHWNRQIEISKGFNWGKSLLNDMMLWASKYDEDEVIECALYKIDLYHLEQNDAPRIVELVAQNDLETALQRIEAFGGNDKEGLQRKFIMYMLCLMELTLLDSKNKPFRKEAIEKLLRHLDDNIPTDHSILNWNDFFPSYLMFQMACEWVEMGLDYLITFKRADDWEKAWIGENGPYSNLQFDVLLQCAREISSDHWKGSTLQDISTEMAKQGQVEQALDIARGIDSDYSYDKKISALKEISAELAKQGLVEEASFALQEALTYAMIIGDNFNKSRALMEISFKFCNLNDIEWALTCAKNIPDKREKSSTYKNICLDLLVKGEIEKSIEFAKNVEDRWDISDFFEIIALDSLKVNDFEKAFEFSNMIPIKSVKSKVISEIALTCLRGNKTRFYLNEIDRFDEYSDSLGLIKIAFELKDEKYFKKAIEIAKSNKDWESHYSRFEEIVKLVIQFDYYDLALEVVDEYKYSRKEYRGSRFLDKGKEDLKELVLISRMINLAKEGFFEKAFKLASDLGNLGLSELANYFIIEEKNLEKASIIYFKSKAGKIASVAENFALLLFNNDKVEDALKVINRIENPYIKNENLINIGICMLAKKQYEFGFQIFSECALNRDHLFGIFSFLNNQQDLSNFWIFLDSISQENQLIVIKFLLDQSKLNLSNNVKKISDQFEKILLIGKEYKNDLVIEELFKRYIVNNELELAESLIRKIQSCIKKASLYIQLGDICIEISNNSFAFRIYEKAFEELKNASLLYREDAEEIDLLLTRLSISMLKIDQYQESIRIANFISDEMKENICLIKLSTLLLDKKEFNKSNELQKKAFSNIDDIEWDPNLNEWKYDAFPEIVKELVIQGKIEYGLDLINSIPDWLDGEAYIKDLSLLSIIEVLSSEKNISNALILCDNFNYHQNEFKAIMIIARFQPDLGRKIELIKKSIVCAKLIKSFEEKCYAFLEIRSELAKYGYESEAVSIIQEALSSARSMTAMRDKARAFKDISIVLWKQGYEEKAASVMQEALTFAREIDDFWKNTVLKDISTGLGKQGLFRVAEDIGMEILQTSERQNCWNSLAQIRIEEIGGSNSIQQVIQFKNDETRYHFIQGWAENVTMLECSKELFLSTWYYYRDDMKSLQKILQKFAINQLLIEEMNPKTIQRLNRTLNIQWAIDLKNLKN